MSLLTLEPLVEAVRDGVAAAGWELSGLQKTTSHEFEGRWAGDSTRSAYLFFHHPERWEAVSVDVYLDETSRGLQGNLALVLEGHEPTVTGQAQATLAGLAPLVARHLPEGYRTPVSLRFRVADVAIDPDDADVEARIKIRIPGTALEAGESAVSALASAVVASFERLLGDPELRRWVETD